MLITLRQLLDHAAENNYGVPAFNVNNLEQLRNYLYMQDCNIVRVCVSIIKL